MPDSTPDYMADAWLSCLFWAIAKDEIMRDFREQTGNKFQFARTPLDQMIDDATGAQEQFVRSFTEWFNQNIWGDVA
jgi:hypothetical protein